MLCVLSVSVFVVIHVVERLERELPRLLDNRSPVDVEVIRPDEQKAVLLSPVIIDCGLHLTVYVVGAVNKWR
jgi:hypothetical protein